VELTFDRQAGLRHALRLEYLTVGWNLLEGLLAVVVALRAGSVALFGFGVDSFVELLSGAILIWRLRADDSAADDHGRLHLDLRALRLVGLSFFLLAAYVAFDASQALLRAERPDPTYVGLGITLVSIVVMLWLGRAKRRLAASLGSRALLADAFQTTACFWLSIFTLVGIGANALFGLWWADPVAALGMTLLLVREGTEAWRGEGCGTCH
jgi:divalent metal cation (Fe/Co/Zn/Cd) transporter